MGNPQVENGYTRIANEILEQVALRKFNGTQWAILVIIWRSTYGWGKTSYSLSGNYISKLTGIDNRNARRELQKLINMNVVTVVKEATFSSAREIAFNKNYDEWLIEYKLNGLQLAKRLTGEEETPRGSNNSQRCNNTTEGEIYPTTEGEIYPTTEGEIYPQKRNIKRNIKRNSSRTTKTKEKILGFTPPTLEEVQAYCIKRNNGVDANKFFDYYEAANWKDGKGNPVRNWKQKMISVWEDGDKNEQGQREAGQKKEQINIGGKIRE